MNMNDAFVGSLIFNRDGGGGEDRLTSMTPVLLSIDKFSGQATYNLDNPTRKATLVNWVTIDNSDNRVVDINGQAFGGKYAFGDASKANVVAGCYGFGYIPDTEDTIICGFQQGDGGMYARGALFTILMDTLNALKRS